MVRLKDPKNEQDSQTEGFQFHYGTIKSVYKGLLVLLERRFNSTMVRLKDPKNEQDSQTEGFQFHYGTIKSLVPTVNKTDVQLVSIPLWYD